MQLNTSTTPMMNQRLTLRIQSNPTESTPTPMTPTTPITPQEPVPSEVTPAPSRSRLVVMNAIAVQESWTIEEVARRATPLGWTEQFQAAMPEIQETSEDINDDERIYGKCFPLRRDLFQAFHLTPLKNVRVVIVGQDPYHSVDPYSGLPQAVGMSFSVRRTAPIPPSLRNIYRNLERWMPGFQYPDHGDLTSWALQGVLLLNKCLTVRKGQAGSHGDLWMGFVTKVLTALGEHRPNAIYMLWGAKAQDLMVKGYIGDRATVLTAIHPSGFNGNKFLEHDHFGEVNKILVGRGETPINWQPQ